MSDRISAVDPAPVGLPRDDRPWTHSVLDRWAAAVFIGNFVWTALWATVFAVAVSGCSGECWSPALPILLWFVSEIFVAAPLLVAALGYAIYSWWRWRTRIILMDLGAIVGTSVFVGLILVFESKW